MYADILIYLVVMVVIKNGNYVITRVDEELKFKEVISLPCFVIEESQFVIYS